MPANPRHLILNLLVGAGGDPLSARNAVASSALFAISESRTRVALARLAAAGLIEAVGRGAYKIGPHAAELAADVATWRKAAERACDGRALRRRYRAKSRHLGDWLARSGTLKPQVAARESFLLGNDAIRDLVFDPWLPAPLVDVEARHVLRRCRGAL